MCRNQSSIDKTIHTMCMVAMTNEESMAELGGKLLSVFRAVCRSDMFRIDDTVGELCYYDGDCYDSSEESRNLNQSLIRLEVFMDEATKDKYDREISSIFEIGQMIRIMEALKIKVYNCCKSGPEFVSILSTCYMNAFDYSYEEACETLNMSISTFYRKKKRAEILFGLAFLEYTACIRGSVAADFGGSQLSMAI